MQRCALCRSRREPSNAYLLAKFGFDTAENEPFQVCPLSAYRSPRYQQSTGYDNGWGGGGELGANLQQIDWSQQQLQAIERTGGEYMQAAEARTADEVMIFKTYFLILLLLNVFIRKPFKILEKPST